MWSVECRVRSNYPERSRSAELRFPLPLAGGVDSFGNYGVTEAT